MRDLIGWDEVGERHRVGGGPWLEWLCGILSEFCLCFSAVSIVSPRMKGTVGLL